MKVVFRCALSIYYHNLRMAFSNEIGEIEIPVSNYIWYDNITNIFDYFEQWKINIGDYLQIYIEERTDSFSRVHSLGKDVAQKLLEFTLQGKMIRGGLVCLGFGLFKEYVSEEATLAAAAIELFQSALLIHDDIMDCDRTRRGYASVYHQYEKIVEQLNANDAEHIGESLGICAGDIAFFLAFELLSELKCEPALHSRILALCARELSYVGIAQMADVLQAVDQKVPAEQDILKLYLHKTGRYSFSLPMVLGGMLAVGDDKTIRQLETLGENLGILFQIKDDELGLFGIEAEVGKPIGSDIKEAKKTLFYHYLMAELGQQEKTKLESIFGNSSITPSMVQYVKELMTGHGIKSKVDEKLSFYADKISRIIDSLEDVSDTYRGLLRNLLEFNLTRKK